MIAYIIKRILLVIPIVLGVTLILFVLMSILAGSTIGFMPIDGGGDALDSVFSFFNANANLFTRYLRYCYDVFVKFDLGRASLTRIPLSFEMSYRIKNTIILLVTSVVATLLVGIPVGVYSAIHKNRLGDRIVSVVTLILSSIPPYTVALCIALFFALQLRLVPVISSYKSPVAFFMPSLTIWLGGISTIARMTRTSMLEVLEQPYIKALRAKGLKESSVIYRHALKNALVPILSVLGGLVAHLLTGAFVVEHFFNIPGLGSYILRSVSSRSHTELLSCTVMLTIMLTILNIIIDILYMLVNPQIRRSYAKKRLSKMPNGGAEKEVA